jgi:hypothetical protein
MDRESLLGVRGIFKYVRAKESEKEGRESLREKEESM